MKTATSLDDFAHDLCVAGLGIAFLSVVGISVFRVSAEPRHSLRNDEPAALSWTEVGTRTAATGSPKDASKGDSKSDSDASITKPTEILAVAGPLPAHDDAPEGNSSQILIADERSSSDPSAAPR